MDWKPEAIEEAYDELLEALDESMVENHSEQIRRCVRAALDAAVEAQGLEAEMRENALRYIAAVGQAQENYARGRAEAFEEAAEIFEDGDLWSGPAASEAIRALAKEPQK